MNNMIILDITRSMIIKPIIILSLVLFSCEKVEVDDDFPDITKSKGIFIINEGNYGWGNASLGYIDFESGKSYHEIFKKANERPLGDVFQSINLINDKLFLVINNSGKIEVVDPYSIKSIKTIEGLKSPRNIEAIGNNIAIVTDLYSNKISILELSEYEVTGHITTSGWTEEITVSDDKIFVSSPINHLIYVINKETLQLSDSISTHPYPGSMAIDQYNNLWVLCSGIPDEGENGALLSIDILTNEIIKEVEISPYSFSRMVINSEKNELFFLSENIWRYSIHDENIEGQAIIKADGRLLYGISINPLNDDIFITDAIDYVQRGIIFNYSNNGLLKDQFEAGIIPGGFFFF